MSTYSNIKVGTTLREGIQNITMLTIHCMFDCCPPSSTLQLILLFYTDCRVSKSHGLMVVQPRKTYDVWLVGVTIAYLEVTFRWPKKNPEISLTEQSRKLVLLYTVIHTVNRNFPTLLIN